MALAGALLLTGWPVIFESSPDPSERGRPWYWRQMRHQASLYQTSWVGVLAELYQMTRATTGPMCSIGSNYRKYFSPLAPQCLTDELRWLGTLKCPRTGHHESHLKARGRTALSQSHAALAGRYPRALNAWLLMSLYGAARGFVSSAVSSSSEADSELSDDDGVEPVSTAFCSSARDGCPSVSEAGRAASGPALDAVVSLKVEDATGACLLP